MHGGREGGKITRVPQIHKQRAWRPYAVTPYVSQITSAVCSHILAARCSLFHLSFTHLNVDDHADADRKQAEEYSPPESKRDKLYPLAAREMPSKVATSGPRCCLGALHSTSVHPPVHITSLPSLLTTGSCRDGSVFPGGDGRSHSRWPSGLVTPRPGVPTERRRSLQGCDNLNRLKGGHLGRPAE